MPPTVKGCGLVKSAKKAHRIEPILPKSKKKEYSRERLEEDPEICLNCTRPNCTGMCKKIEESRREISAERKAKRSGLKNDRIEKKA